MKNLIMTLFFITLILTLGDYPTHVKEIGYISYAGMLNPNTFSVVYSSNGGDGNRFYPIDSPTILIHNKRFRVIKVTKKELHLKSI